MKTKIRAIALGAGLSVAPIAMLAAPMAAHADTTCYTSCTTTTTTPTGSAAAGAATTTTSPVTGAAAALPFTGADIGEMAAVGAGAILLGAVMVRRNRRSNALQS